MLVAEEWCAVLWRRHQDAQILKIFGKTGLREWARVDAGGGTGE